MHARATTPIRPRGRKRLASRYRRQHRRLSPQRSLAPFIAPAIVEGEVITIRDDYQPFAPPPKPRMRVPLALAAVLAVLSLVVGSGLAVWLSPVFLATATITLTPETPARIQQLGDLDVVQPPRPSANRGELEGNLLAALIQQLSVGWAGHGRTWEHHVLQRPASTTDDPCRDVVGEFERGHRAH